MEQTQKVTTTNNPTSKYESNPFVLTFAAMGRFFQHNLAWAIVLIVLSILSFAGNTVGNFMETYQEKNNPEQTEQIFDKSNQASITGDSAAKPADSADVIGGIAVVGLIIVGILIVIAIIILVFATIGVLVQGVLTHVALESEKGRSVGFKEAVQASANKFGIFYLSSVLATFKIIGWSLLFIIPGIIASLRYAMLPYVVMSDAKKKYVKVSDVHKRSKELVKGRLAEVFGINFVAGIIPFVGGILSLSGYAAEHNQLAYYTDNKKEKPKVHWTNYLLIGLAVFGVLMIIGFIVLIVIFANFS